MQINLVCANIEARHFSADCYSSSVHHIVSSKYSPDYLHCTDVLAFPFTHADAPKLQLSIDIKVRSVAVDIRRHHLLQL